MTALPDFFFWPTFKESFTPFEASNSSNMTVYIIVIIGHQVW